MRPGNCVAFSVDTGNREEACLVAEVGSSVTPEDLGLVMESVIKAVGQEHELGLTRVVLIRSGTLPKTTSGKLQRSLTAKKLASGDLEVVAQWPITTTNASSAKAAEGNRVEALLPAIL